MFQKRIILLALLLPCAAHASDISRQLMCDMRADDFFSRITQNRLIDLNSYTSADSINYFYLAKARPRSKPVDRVTAFGMTVTGVLGYVSGQYLFERGPGTEPPNTFGVLIDGDVDSVKAKLKSAGAYKTIAVKASSKTTEIYCQDIS